MNLEESSRDRVFTRCAHAISDAGQERESLFLARLALLLFEQVGDEPRCMAAIDSALENLPYPSLSKPAAPATAGTTNGPL